MGETEQPLQVNVDDLHTFTKQIDALIQCAERMIAEKPAKGGRELALVRTKLQESKMWCGKVLEEIDSPLPPQYADKV